MSSYLLGKELTGIALQNRTATLQDEVAQLFLEAREDVYRYLLSLGLYPPQAQEGAQEVFLRLYATLRKGEKIQNPRAWIFRVAHNLGLKIRARQNTRAPFDASLESQIADSTLNPEQSLLERSVNFGKSTVDIGPRRGWRWKVAMENVLSIAYTFADGVLLLLELRAAFPTGLEMRADAGCGAGRRFSVGVTEQLLLFGVAHLRHPHSSLFFSRAIARLRNSPTAEALIPSADAISG